MSEKKKERSPRLYELVEERRVRTARARSPLEEVLEEEERELAREARRLRLQELIEERRSRLEELRRRVSASMPPGVEPNLAQAMASKLIADPNMRRQWLEMSDEERAKVLQGVQMFMAMSNIQPSGAMWFLPAIMQMYRGGSRSGSELAEIVGKFVDALQKGGSKPLDTFKSAVDLVKPIYETLSTKEREAFEARLEAIRKELESKIVNPIEWVKGVKEAAKELGFGERTGDAELEAKRLEMEHRYRQLQLQLEDKWKERDFQFRQWLYQQAREDARWERIMATLLGVVRQLDLRGAARDAVREIFGRPPGEQPPQPVQPGGRPGGLFTRVECPKCRSPIVVTPDAEEKGEVSCLVCGARWRLRKVEAGQGQGGSGAGGGEAK